MTELQIESTMTFMRQLWPDWTNGAEVLLYSQEFAKYDEDGVLDLLKEAAKKNDYLRPSKKVIFDGLKKLRRQGYESMPIIMVYALRDDGKSMEVGCRASNPDHAESVMRNYMLNLHDREYDCHPDPFVFYVGKENYHAFTEARREKRRTG